LPYLFEDAVVTLSRILGLRFLVKNMMKLEREDFETLIPVPSFNSLPRDTAKTTKPLDHARQVYPQNWG
jgi:hypothetical protein